MKSYNTVIIGGGFYGLSVALFLRDELGIKNILIIEKEDSLMSRASYVNQARVHNGYHYPRSLLTAHRSHVNFDRFVRDHKKAVKSNFAKYYAISRHLSKINALQFEGFVKKIGAELDSAPAEITKQFNNRLIEKVYAVKEYAFHSYKLRDMLLARIAKDDTIQIHTEEEVKLLKKANSQAIHLTTDKDEYYADFVLNCTYSQINTLHRNSRLPVVPLKHEIAEMCLVKLPPELKDFSVTVMDGPFFSIMPFPTTPYHTLSHVRYTPHMSWADDQKEASEIPDPHRYFGELDLKTNFRQMVADVARYIPALADMKYAKSVWEVKTVLMKSEKDDSRPILFRSDFGLSGYTCIMGGKLDNIYDVFEGLEGIYGQKN